MQKSGVGLHWSAVRHYLGMLCMVVGLVAPHDQASPRPWCVIDACTAVWGFRHSWCKIVTGVVVTAAGVIRIVTAATELADFHAEMCYRRCAVVHGLVHVQLASNAAAPALTSVTCIHVSTRAVHCVLIPPLNYRGLDPSPARLLTRNLDYVHYTKHASNHASSSISCARSVSLCIQI
jgi:hypothetical protein